ncbi:unnamed protein product [Prorocentrum cordatum]|uniref:Uncharacterized protein n=1 Tax=Prorocentrum cordatum TaxID=2364126 RepID=A0ABN9Y6U5_9DINO|nr:unnamed protein product [Polarella glacialis]
MDHILSRMKACPYMDFGVYGPYHHRLMRRMRFTGMTQDPDGTTKITEPSVPVDCNSWVRSHEVPQPKLLGFAAVGLGTLIAYRKKYDCNLYGAETWGIQYQADARCRPARAPGPAGPSWAQIAR